MNARKNVNGRDEFERLVRQARFERAVYIGEALADLSAALWSGIARAGAALRTALGAARHGRPAARRSLATR